MARILFSDFREPAAGEAYEIAYGYLAGSGLLRDEYETFVFLAQSITAMVDQGLSNRILMANLAISAYQQSHLGRDPIAAADHRPAGTFSRLDRRFR